MKFKHKLLSFEKASDEKIQKANKELLRWFNNNRCAGHFELNEQLQKIRDIYYTRGYSDGYEGNI